MTTTPAQSAGIPLRSSSLGSTRGGSHSVVTKLTTATASSLTGSAAITRSGADSHSGLLARR